MLLTLPNRNIMQTHIQKCADAAAQHISSLLEDENEPFTMNTHYYAEYRSKFLNHYKSERLRSKSSFIRNLEDNNMTDAINETIASLARLGLHSVDASSLATLLPPDPMEPAIEIMANVRAYFQGRRPSILSFTHNMADAAFQWHTSALLTTYQ
jgi:hypothetical protein